MNGTLAGRGMALVALAAVLLSGCEQPPSDPVRNGAGDVVGAGQADWGRLEVGDCVVDDLTGSGSLASKASVTPCPSGQARAQLIATSSAKSWSATRPADTSDDGLKKWCQTAFQTFLGITPNKSQYGMNLVSPQGESDSVQCFVVSTDAFTGTLQNVKK